MPSEPRTEVYKIKAEICISAFLKRMAATYSRGIYKTTTIGNAAFDGRVRNGIGSGHSFKATKKLKRSIRAFARSPN